MTRQSIATTKRRLRYAAIAVAVLTVAAGIVLLVKLTAGPAPVDYKVTAHGNISATWTSDTGTGKLDMYTGDGMNTIHAGSLTITVQSTMLTGATCAIKDTAGNTIDKHAQFPPEGSTGLDAWTTATCATSDPSLAT